MITVAFTGDIAFSGYFKGKYKDDILDEKVTRFLSDSDYTVANVECVVADMNDNKQYIHTTPPEAVDFLKSINANVWNLANNHICDFKEEGIIETVKSADLIGAKTIGAGKVDGILEPLILYNGKIGIVSVVEGTIVDHKTIYGPSLWEDSRLQDVIKRTKSMCKWCVVVAHGGEEFSPMPLIDIRERYMGYLECGADVVVAHHPHVVQNYETVGDKIIFYSLGNFIFDTDYQRTQNNTEDGMLIKIHFGDDSFWWESQATKIDRDGAVIKAVDNHGIFANIDERNYKMLYPLIAKKFEDNYIKKHETWWKRKLGIRSIWKRRKRIAIVHGRKTLLSGLVHYRFKRYDLNDPVVKYLKES